MSRLSNNRERELSNRGQSKNKKQASTEAEVAVASSSAEGDRKYVITEDGADCVVYLPKGEFIGDLPTLNQIKDMIKHPVLKGQKIRIMPDVHRCYGCCVGLSATLGQYIEPRLIGPDVGCGMVVYPLDPKFFKNRSLEKMEKILKQTVYMGSGHENIPAKVMVTDREMQHLYEHASKQAQKFSASYRDKFGIDISSYIPSYSEEWLRRKCHQVRSRYETDVLRTLCSIGGGNHFLEVNEDTSTGQRYISVHCGSRTFGGQIYSYHQDKITFGRQFPLEEFLSEVKSIERHHKDTKTIKKKTDEIREEINANKHAPYLEGEEAYEYYFDMIFCQQYACLNRRLILGSVLQALDNEYDYVLPPMDEGDDDNDDDLPPLVPNANHYIQPIVRRDLTSYFDENLIIESIHNYIDFNDLCIRKGAISAHEGQKCIIALNMKRGLAIGLGRGNPDWNYSCSHGAGRKYPRGQASRHLNMKQFRKDMESVVTTSICVDTLDECPQAYKDSDFILGLVGDTVEITQYLKAIINLKAPN